MKRLWFIAILAASASACVEGNNPVQLLSAVPQGAESCAPGDIALTNGRLNYDASSSYIITFGLFSPISTEETGAAASPAAFYAEEIVYNYTSRNPVVSFIEESLPIYFVVPAGAQPGNSWLAINLIGSEARKKLESAVLPAPDFMTLLATVKIKGKLPSGKAVETNEVTFPIDITRAGGCSTGVPVVLTESGEPAGPCAYPGQDQYFVGFGCVTPGG
ncbi:MAG TPA: hypothetical protein VNA24_07735 [Hyalangium sp.]|jgi:hypothetical protein|nr:hypothetical protein [Hyalangium sp.]